MNLKWQQQQQRKPANTITQDRSEREDRDVIRLFGENIAENGMVTIDRGKR